MDFDDVEQKLRLHIFKKWDKWNPELPLIPWVNTVITNQIINLVKNNYSNFSRPCLGCVHNGGANICKKFDLQSSDCPDYAKWEKTKKHAYNVKLPVSIHDESIFGEGREFDSKSKETDNINFDNGLQKMHTMMLKELLPIYQKVYKHLFIDGKTEAEVIPLMGYKSASCKNGYKFIKKARAIILAKAKNIVLDVF
jgi:hypothetical protein